MTVARPDYEAARAKYNQCDLARPISDTSSYIRSLRHEMILREMPLINLATVIIGVVSAIFTVMYFSLPLLVLSPLAAYVTRVCLLTRLEDKERIYSEIQKALDRPEFPTFAEANGCLNCDMIFEGYKAFKRHVSQKMQALMDQPAVVTE